MAVGIHDNFRNAQLGVPANSTTTVDFDADDIDCSLLDADDSGAIIVATENYGDVDGAVVVADRSDSAEVPLTTPTVGSVATGVFNADDVTFTTITGDAADYLTLYKYDATPANATLIATWDSDITGLAVTPNGGDITVTWNASGIIRI
jgi:hypothetical protein